MSDSVQDSLGPQFILLCNLKVRLTVIPRFRQFYEVLLLMRLYFFDFSVLLLNFVDTLLELAFIHGTLLLVQSELIVSHLQLADKFEHCVSVQVLTVAC